MLTDDPKHPGIRRGSGAGDSEPVPQNDAYLVLSDAELAKGFVRPVRYSYVHDKARGGCGGETDMSAKLAETYAREPAFYGATYCFHCRMHKPVGVDGEFVWSDDGAPVGS